MENLMPILRNLLFKYHPNDIQNALINIYIQRNRLRNISNILLLDTQTSINSKIVDVLNRYVGRSFTLKALETCFQHLFSSDIKRERGVVYTPTYIIDYIVDYVVTREGLTCDVSCGSGGFLIQAAKKLQALTGKGIVDVLENYIYGCDISPDSINRAKILLSLLAEDAGYSKEIIQFHLVNGNSLLMNWFDEFPQLKLNKGFDFIIGNPPYVKIQNMDHQSRELIPKRWSTVGQGSHNLYIPFLQAGAELLNNNGKLGYIVYSMYFKSIASRALREYLQTRKLVERIVDFGELQIFDYVQTYTCLTFLNKGGTSYIEYAYLNHTHELRNPEITKIYYSDLDPRKWRLLTKQDYVNIQRIEQSGLRLNQIADISTGIATLKDSLYSIDSASTVGDYYIKIYSGKRYRIEKDITREFIKVSDFANSCEMRKNTRRIIYPYSSDQRAVIMEENYLKKEYPNAYNYLCAIRGELEGRDKGEKKYDTWYAYGRSQGLNNIGKKLLTPTFSNGPRFMLCENESTLFCNGYAITLKDAKQRCIDDFFGTKSYYDIYTLCRLLNSKIMDYYIKKTSYVIQGGYYCYQKQFIETFGLPAMTQKDYHTFLSCSDSGSIDEYLMAKYDLNF